MKAAGIRIHLVTWCGDAASERPEPAHLDAMREVVDVLHVFPIRRSFGERMRRLARLHRWPSHVASRVLTAGQQAQVRATLGAFRPEAVWLDSLYPVVAARDAASQFGLPVFYRSHNIEHLYMERQVARARTLRDRFAWGLNLLHLKKIEFEVIGKAAGYFDISIDDLSYWQSQGFSQGAWLPPLIEPEFGERLSAPWDEAPEFDVGYLGNLYTPNNVEGIVWFLNRVVPRLQSHRPGVRIFVAGSRPAQAVRDALAQCRGVTLIESPPDAISVLRSARVLVNPVFAGSGVNVKSVEMLFAPGEIVSAPQGLTGLPDHVRSCFHAAESDSAFAETVLDALQNPRAISAERLKARQEFSFGQIESVIDSLRRKSGAVAA
jgi:hypothetical protein